jgi:hypothetical protein
MELDGAEEEGGAVAWGGATNVDALPYTGDTFLTAMVALGGPDAEFGVFFCSYRGRHQHGSGSAEWGLLRALVVQHTAIQDSYVSNPHSLEVYMLRVCAPMRILRAPIPAYSIFVLSCAILVLPGA